jgi:hypothetical protein
MVIVRKPAVIARIKVLPAWPATSTEHPERVMSAAGKDGTF